MNRERIPFNFAYATGNELDNIAAAQANGQLAGDGPFTKLCHDWIEQRAGCAKALLTHSCTGALEMAALLLDIVPGDEIIMPSYTFVSTANAFVLRGGIPVFVDVRQDTLNLDERLIEAAITPRTKVIVPVHYAGVGCAMDEILAIADGHGIQVVEDAAQAFMTTYKGKPLGTLGALGTYSFHETKNVVSGEGGSLLINAPELCGRAEIIREKGTDRSRFFRGEVDKYTWQDIGSSFLPGELVAAYLWAQLQDSHNITAKRRAAWQRYHDELEPLEQAGLLRRPIVPDDCTHNAHMYYVLLSPELQRRYILDEFRSHKISSHFHYVPLHSSPAGQRYGRSSSNLPVTSTAAERLVRLPLFAGLTGEQQDRVIDVLRTACATVG